MPVPVMTSSAIICQSRGCPVRTRIPNVPSPRAIIRLPAMITSWGRIRSATTPPASVKISDGRICAASTRDRSKVDPVVCSTANETPTSENP